MSKRFSLGRVVAAAVIAALAAFGSTEAVAEDFGAVGQITDIDEGNVKAAGKSGRFVVKERTVTGTLSGIVGGTSVNEEFTFTFGTNVPLMTQSGNIHGTLTFGNYEAKVAAKSQLGITPVGYPGLLINGTLTFTDGTQGHGVVDAWVIPNIVDGHIVGVHAGMLTIQGN